MEKIDINWNNIEIEEYNSIIIGAGAAGLNCAIHLASEGIDPSQIAIITDNLGGGTSFNAGSDKQTYYKMSMIGEQLDSPFLMAEALYNGGAMHGDIALIEATNSIREFFHLIQLGVPFPHDKYGGYVGYKTDNDPLQRATSIGPLTSQKMSQCLLKAVQDLNINILNHYYAIKVLVDNTKTVKQAIGLVCIRTVGYSEEKAIDQIAKSFKFLKSKNIIIATGGPAQLYKHSVYPTSQFGMAGLAIEAGCKLQNLTESQFGLASIKFRWNLSGSYQQVIPRYFSIDENKNEKEFLNEYFTSFQILTKAIFLKGYQWPFNADRVENFGSSLIDLAVYHETEILGRKVYLDFTKNTFNYNFEELSESVKEYLINSNARGENPIDRLKNMNKESYKIYLENGIDLEREPIQIAVCNQHLNGGISTNEWWETNIKNLFAIGEISGNHGVHRPGGAALNAGQVGGLRAAKRISRLYNDSPSLEDENFIKLLKPYLKTLNADINASFQNGINLDPEKLFPLELMAQIQDNMSNVAGILRSFESLKEKIEVTEKLLAKIKDFLKIENPKQIIRYFQCVSALLTHLSILLCIQNYHAKKGCSRGSYLILRDNLDKSISERYAFLPGDLKDLGFIISELKFRNLIQTIEFDSKKFNIEWEEVRPLPKTTGWFETDWKKFVDGNIYK